MLLITFISLSIRAQCVATPANGGNTFANDNSTGTINFANVANASITDGNYAAASVTLSLLGSAKTKYLKATNFNFSIPDGAMICGVQAEVHKKGTGTNLLNTIIDDKVFLVVGGIITGDNKATDTKWLDTDFTETYGAANDLWGAALTPAVINSADFGVVLSAAFTGITGTSLTAAIDQISITVFYNANITLPVKLNSFTADISYDDAVLHWSTSEEEDQVLFILQRSHNNAEWTDVFQQKQQYHTGNHYYEYIDHLDVAGNYNYRLQLVAATKAIIYSPIKSLHYNQQTLPVVFPNPSQSNITIKNIESTDRVYLFNLLQQPVKATQHWTAVHTLQLDVQHLPAGLYYIKAGNQSIPFYKNQ